MELKKPRAEDEEKPLALINKGYKVLSRTLNNYKSKHKSPRMSRRKKYIAITVFLISILLIITIFFSVLIVSNEYNSGGYSLEGIYFKSSPYVFCFTTPSDPPLNESLKDDFHNSTFYLLFEIKEANYMGYINYSYVGPPNSKYDQMRQNRSNDRIYFTNWSYNIVYHFTVKFIVNSTNDTIKYFSLFNENRYISGSFLIRKSGNSDSVTFSNLTGNFVRSKNEPYFVYLGEASDAESGNIFALSIRIREYGLCVD